MGMAKCRTHQVQGSSRPWAAHLQPLLHVQLQLHLRLPSQSQLGQKRLHTPTGLLRPASRLCKATLNMCVQGRGAGSDPAAHPPPPPPQPDSAFAQPLTSQTDYPVTSSTSRGSSPTSTCAGPAAAPDRASTSGAGMGPGAPHPSSWRLRAACLPSASASSPAYPAGGWTNALSCP